MSIIRRALGAIRPEVRALSNNSFLTGNDLSTAGIRVSRDTAAGIPAVYAAIRLYADTIASLPIGAYVRVQGERRPYFPRPSWLDTPAPQDPNLTGFDFRHRLVTSLLTDGNAFILTIRNERGDVVEAHVLDPRNVDVKLNADRSRTYSVRAGSTTETLDATDIVHISLFTLGDEPRGLSPIEHHRRTMGLAIASESFAEKFFSQGATVGGMIEVPGELTPEQAQGLRDAFSSRHEGISKAHRIAVLSGGAKFSSLPIKIGELALVEQMGWSVEQIARIYAIPLALLSVATPGAQSYASVEAQITAWLRTGLNPMIVRIEAGFQRMVFGDTTFIRFNTDALLRPTTLERYQAHAVALGNGWLSANDVRRLEDQAPIEGGDSYLRPLNLAPMDTADMQAKANLFAALTQAGVEMGEAARLAGLDLQMPEPEDETPPPPTAPIPAEEVDTTPGELLSARHLAGEHDQNRHGGAAYAEAVAAALPQGVPVGSSFADNYTPDGKFTPQRAALHRQIVDEALAGVQPTGEQPVFTVMGGGPAAGKSTFLSSPDSSVPGSSRAVIVNADDVKTKLPEYQQMVAGKNPKAAPYVHEEASHIAGLIQTEARARGLDVVLDGTGDSSAAKLTGKTGAYASAGYRVRGVYVTAPTNDAVARAAARGAKTGRYVPEATIRATHASVSRIVPEVATKAFDEFELWDTTSGLKKIASATKGGTLDILDPPAWDAFVAKGKE